MHMMVTRCARGLIYDVSEECTEAEIAQILGGEDELADSVSMWPMNSTFDGTALLSASEARAAVQCLARGMCLRLRSWEILLPEALVLSAVIAESKNTSKVTFRRVTMGAAACAAIADATARSPSMTTVGAFDDCMVPDGTRRVFWESFFRGMTYTQMMALVSAGRAGSARTHVRDLLWADGDTAIVHRVLRFLV